MPCQAVRHVVGGADGLHMGLRHEFPGGKPLFPDAAVGLLPDGLGRVPPQGCFNAEETAQLHVRPHIQGITRRKFQRLRIHEKFFVPGSAAGDEALVDPGAAHQPPLVVVCAQPHFTDVFKGSVLKDFPGGQMAMIVDDRQFFCFFIERARCLIFQKSTGCHNVPPLDLHYKTNPFLISIANQSRKTLQIGTWHAKMATGR